MTAAAAAAESGHKEKRGPREKTLSKYSKGALRVDVRQGSVLDEAESPIAVPQKLRITLLLADDPSLYRKKKDVGPPYTATFVKVPAGRVIVVVENLSDVPAYPGAVAEVTVKPARKTSAGKASPPTACKVKLSTDTLGDVARACGFTVGAREDAPERRGTILGDHYARFFNARVLIAFWNPSRRRHVPSPPVTAGQSFVVLNAGAEQTPAKRTNWDGIPTAPDFGQPSLAMQVPNGPDYDPKSSVPTNLVYVRHAQTGQPLLSGGKEILGLVQAQAPGDGAGIPYDDVANRLQITFVRRVDGGTESNLEVVPPQDVPAVPIRYYRHHPPLATAQHTALVWKSINGAPPSYLPPLKGDKLIGAMADYVHDTIRVHRSDRDGERQYVVVNEPILGSVGPTTLGKGKVVDALVKARKKGAKALFAAIRKHRVPAATFARWLAQNHTKEGHWWLRKTGRTMKYVVAAYRAAATADPDAKLILNEHSIESMDRSGKGLALAVLVYMLKKRLAKAPGNAARRLSVGFQMHLGDNFYGKEMKPFLKGLRKSIDYYTRFLKMRLYVTEMGIRMPGFERFEEGAKRLQCAYSISRLVNLVRAGGHAPNEPLFRVETAPVNGAPAPVKILVPGVELREKVKTKKGGKTVTEEIKVKRTVAVDLVTGAISADGAKKGAAGGLTMPEIEVWIKSYSKIARAVHSVLNKDLASRFTNVNTFEGYSARLEALVPKTTPKQRRQQAELFYKVARTCLSSPRCDDLNFWGVADSVGNDSYDLFGFLFARPFDPGAPAPGIPFKLKPAYFGVLQALIESAIAKERKGIEAYARAHRRSARTRGKHAYEEHLFRSA